MSQLLYTCFAARTATTQTLIACLLIGLMAIAPVSGQNKSGLGGGQFGLPTDLLSGGLGSEAGSVSFAAKYEIENGSRSGRVTVTADVSDGWHIFSVTQLEGGPKPTKITVASEFVKLAGPFTPNHDPEIAHQDDIWPGLPIEEHHGQVVWSAPIELSSDIDPQKTVIDLVFEGQVCQEACIPINEKVPAKFAGYYGTAEKSTSFKAKNTHATWSATLSPAQLKPGQTGKIVIKADTDPGYHVYPFTTENPESTDYRTLIVATQKSGLKFGLPATSAGRESIDIGLAKPVEYHVGAVEWEIPVRVPPTAAEGQYPIEIQVGFFTCNEQSCDPQNAAIFNGTFQIASQSSDNVVAMSVAGTPYKTVAGLDNLVSWVDRSDAQAGSTISLNIWHILAALAGGFILNLMPCVLPVVGLKLMSFVNQAGSSRTRIITLNLSFVAGILAVMLVLAAVTIVAKVGYGQAFGWGKQFERLDFQVGLAMLVFAMALSFLGVWEIPIPGFATSGKSGELMAKEGHFGAFLKGILTTVLATPCSGPFLGALFGLTLSLSPVSIVLLYMTLGIGLGLPYLALCLYPGFVKFLPKPGAWMDTLKQVLAFPLLLTVVYIIQIVNPDYRIATLILLMIVWFACWLIGRVPAYAEGYRIRTAWFSGIAATAIGAVIAFSFFGPVKHHLPWEPYNEAQLAEYRREGKTVMIEFTARWCATCQVNMRFAIDREEVAKVVKENDIITMLADKSEPSPAIDAKIQELGMNSIPLVAIYSTDAEPVLLRDAITQSQLIEALKQAGAKKSDDSDHTAIKPVATNR